MFTCCPSCFCVCCCLANCRSARTACSEDFLNPASPLNVSVENTSWVDCSVCRARFYIERGVSPVASASNYLFDNQPILLCHKRRLPCKRSSATGNRTLSLPPIYRLLWQRGGFYTCCSSSQRNRVDRFLFVYAVNYRRYNVSCWRRPPLFAAAVGGVRSIRSMLARPAPIPQHLQR